ncbi:NADH-quinone oxidoreductase subunit J [Proteiniphilum sp. UBA5384]|uniref:NADH-quinone oxidoreductase subunit J family protein n=1 Tax=Proteiniphilum sp. UBA5384 TaxID=1947279 RepID=UPI0025F774BA|nr:NADH-quinone oxidoreductase subunit J [Proteiniphilum sp. UBA5384]
MLEQIIFSILAIAIALFSVLAVTSKRIIRSAIYLLFVLLATAGLFLMLNYHFLFAVQVTVYAGGIMVLFIMAIFLTHKPGKIVERRTNLKIISSILLSGGGLILCGYIILRNVTRVYNYLKINEINMQDIGRAMMGTEKYQFLLPFEAISLLLLACIIGAIMIARKEKNIETNDNKDLDHK